MFDFERHSLPSWFERPVPDAETSKQRCLFTTTLHKELACLRVSADEVVRWQGQGWVSVDASADSEIDQFNDPKIREIAFVRDVVRSGLSDAQIDWLLSQLPKPYAFDPSRIAYSFMYGWVAVSWEEEPEPDELDPDELVEAHLETWLEGLDESRLRELRAHIANLIEREGTGDEGENL